MDSANKEDVGGRPGVSANGGCLVSGSRPAGIGAFDLVTVEDVAAAVGCSAGVIWRRIARGEIPVVRIGRRCTRIRRDDLQRLVGHPEGAPNA